MQLPHRSHDPSKAGALRSKTGARKLPLGAGMAVPGTSSALYLTSADPPQCKTSHPLSACRLGLALLGSLAALGGPFSLLVVAGSAMFVFGLA